MMEFRVDTHKLTGRLMVEVYRDGEFVAAIYSHDDGMRIVSKHLDGVEHEVGDPPAVLIRFTE